MPRILLIFLISIFLPQPAIAITGDDTAPGDACNNYGSVRMSGSADGGNAGGYLLSCDGTTWRALFRSETPILNTHVANKTYVDTAVAAAGGGLKVYHSDGTTVIGNFTGMTEPGCVGVNFVDASGDGHGQLSAKECVAPTLSEAYFTSFDCAGTAWGSVSGYRAYYACTGAANCTTELTRNNAEGSGWNTGVASKRTTSGDCVAASGTFLLRTYIYPSLCGLGLCLVK